MDSVVNRFSILVCRFVVDEITPDEFADESLVFWRNELSNINALGDLPEAVIIGDLCLEADALSNQPPYKVTEDELRQSARKALDQLTALQAERNKSV